MIDWQTVMQHPAVLSVGWALVHALWLGAVLAGGLWAALRLMRGRPGLRYHACAAALVSLPLLIALVLVLQRPWERVLDRVAEAEHTSSATAQGALPIYILPAGPAREVASSDATPTQHDAPGAAPSPADRAQASGRGWFALALPYAVVLYGVGLVVMGLRLLGGWWLTLGLRRRGLSPLPAAVVELAERARRASGVRRAVRFVVSSRAAVPCVVGVLRPIVLLPVAAVSGLTPAQLSAVFAHELAHVRRHDVLINLLQVVIETLLFFHPAVWWVGAQLRAERECCCDDDAAASVGSALTVAEALAAVAGLCRSRPGLALAAADGGLTRRVRRLLVPSERHQGRSSAWGMGLLALLVLSVTLTIVACGDASEDAPSREPASQEPSTPDTPGETNADASGNPTNSASSVDNVTMPANRILKIDFQKLKAGDMRYNVVIRPGDVISVPDPGTGFVYMMGKVKRPGAYTVPGPRELTLLRLFYSAGGLGEQGPLNADAQASDPIDVELIRTMPEGEQKVYYFNMADVMAGLASDIYLWPNDVINVGKSPRPGDEHVPHATADGATGRPPIIDEPWEPAPPEGVIFSPITQQDMAVSDEPYVIGVGDTLRVTIFELRIPGRDDIQDRRVTEEGEVRLAIVGPIKAQGRTPVQLERDIAAQLERDGKIRNATVTVQMLDSRQNTYSVFSQSSTGGTQSGTYVIPRPDFRLIEALTIARGVPGRTQYLYVIRGGMASGSADQDQDKSGSESRDDEAQPPAIDGQPQSGFRLIESLTHVVGIPPRTRRVEVIRDAELDPAVAESIGQFDAVPTAVD